MVTPFVGKANMIVPVLFARRTALRTFHTEFPEPLLHEIAWGFNTENTEGSGKGGLPSLSVLRQFFFVPSVLNSLPQ